MSARPNSEVVDWLLELAEEAEEWVRFDGELKVSYCDMEEEMGAYLIALMRE